jgi:hypothetical protein
MSSFLHRLSSVARGYNVSVVTFVNVFGVICVVVGLLLINSWQGEFGVVLLILGFSSIASTLFLYLQGDGGRSAQVRQLSAKLNAHEALASEAYNALEKKYQVAVGLPEETEAERNRLLEERARQFQAEVDAKVRDDQLCEVTSEYHLKLIDEAHAYDVHRSREVIAALRRRGNINLIVGVATTLFAAIMLVFTATSAQEQGTMSVVLLKYFIPRISTVVFIEVFAFFFLKLYKSTLDEERYHQDELTAKVARHTALHTALRLCDTQATSKLIEILAGYGAGRTSFAKPEEGFDLKKVGDLLESAAKVVSASKGGK